MKFHFKNDDGLKSVQERATSADQVADLWATTEPQYQISTKADPVVRSSLIAG
jgi:hypothetical protein